MPRPARPVLALVFTPGVTLDHWRRAGLLEREVRYYEALAARIGPVAFVTAGGRTLPESASIRAVSATAMLRDAPRIVKTNQLAGAALAVAARIRGSRLVARGGYVGSEPWRHRSRIAPSHVVATLREAVLCAVADLVIVTTAEAAAYVRGRYRMQASRVAVVPNFVEIERFEVARAPEPGRVVMVGRLTPEKRLDVAAAAAAAVDGISLRLVGDGPLRPALAALGPAVVLDGPVAHERIPAVLAHADLYLSTSRFEGHPKALLEAMAAGVPPVVAPAPGLVPLVEDGVTGYVARGMDPGAVRDALRRALADPARPDVGARARAMVRARFAREIVLAAEVDAYARAGLLP